MTPLEYAKLRWQLIIDCIPLSPELYDCPLCKAYKRCEDCPVALKTGRTYCEETPYIDWIVHRAVHNPQSNIQKCYCPVCIEIAKRYYEFLQSLDDNDKKKV